MRLVLAALALASLPVPAAAAQAPAGVIAYERDGTVYVARPDGTGERAYTAGRAPALAHSASVVAYSARAGNAWQLMVGRLDGPVRQATALPDREAEFGPERHGVVGSTWSPDLGSIAVRLMEGSTTTLGILPARGGAITRLEFGHLFGSVLAWRDEQTLAVGTDTGLHLVTVNGDVSDPPGREPGDTPVAWLDGQRLAVNDQSGLTALDTVTGKRQPLLEGAVGLAPADPQGVLYARGSEVGFVGGDGRPRVLDTLPAGVQVLAGNAVADPPLVEVAGTDGTVTIQQLATGVFAGPGPAPGGVRRDALLVEVARGSGVAVSRTTPYDAVVPAAPATSAAPSTSGPPTRSTGPTPAQPPSASPGRQQPLAGAHAWYGDLLARQEREAAARSTFVRAVPAADEVSTEPSRLATNLLLALLLMLLVTFPAELFNNTLEEHYDEVRGWFRLKPRAAVTTQPRPRRLAVFAACTAVAALLYGLLDPAFGADAKSARLYAGLLLGIVVVTAVFALAPLAYARRRYAERGLLRALPGTLLVAVACVAVSRAVDFQPGYLYGVIGGFAFARAFSRDEEGRNAFVAAAGVFIVSLAAWLVWQPVDAAASDGDAGLLLGLADATLATVAVGGLQGLVIGLVPLRSLQGYALARWRRPVWVAAYGVVLFAFVHLLLRPGPEAQRPSSYGTWLALFVGFGVLSVAFWGFFQVRQPRVSSG